MKQTNGSTKGLRGKCLLEHQTAVGFLSYRTGVVRFQAAGAGVTLARRFYIWQPSGQSVALLQADTSFRPAEPCVPHAMAVPAMTGMMNWSVVSPYRAVDDFPDAAHRLPFFMVPFRVGCGQTDATTNRRFCTAKRCCPVFVDPMQAQPSQPRFVDRAIAFYANIVFGYAVLSNRR